MSALIQGKFVGVYQESDEFLVRFVPDKKDSEIDFPITVEQFHSLPMNKSIKLIVEVVV